MNSKEKAKHRRTEYFKYLVSRLKDDNDNRCQICNIQKKKGMHPHHLDESTYGYETRNDLVLLCPSCHKNIEWLLSRTKNPVNIDQYCERLNDIYRRSGGLLE